MSKDEIQIIDYCFLDGNDKTTWGSWCSWGIQQDKEEKNTWTRWVFNKWQSYADGSLKLFSDYDGGSIGGPNAYQGIRHRDYWLKISVPSNIKKIENLRLKYCGGNGHADEFVVGVFANQTDVMYAPILTGKETEPLSSSLCVAPENIDEWEETTPPPCDYLDKVYIEKNLLLAGVDGLDSKKITDIVQFTIPSDGYPYVDLSFPTESDEAIYYINIKRNSRRTETGKTASYTVNVNNNTPWAIETTNTSYTYKEYTVEYKIYYTASDGNEYLYDGWQPIDKVARDNTKYAIRSLKDIPLPTGNTYSDTNFVWYEENGQSFSAGTEYTPDRNITFCGYLSPISYDIKINTKLQMFDYRGPTDPEDGPEELNSLLTNSLEQAQVYYGTKVELSISLDKSNAKRYYMFDDNNAFTSSKTIFLDWTKSDTYYFENDNNKFVHIPVDMHPVLFPCLTPAGDEVFYDYYRVPRGEQTYCAYITTDWEPTDNSYELKRTTHNLGGPPGLSITPNESATGPERYIAWPPSLDKTLTEFLARKVEKYQDAGTGGEFSAEVPVSLVPEGTPDSNIPKYIVQYSPFGVYFNSEDTPYNPPGAATATHIELPTGEQGATLFWSTTQTNGTPRYQSGDLVGTHTITRLFSTTQTDSDYLLSLIKEVKKND